MHHGLQCRTTCESELYNNNVQIVQNQDHVVILTEMVHDARMVPLDGRPHTDEAIGLWTGDSRGHWEGDTLVVETRNFNGLTHSFFGLGVQKTNCSWKNSRG